MSPSERSSSHFGLAPTDLATGFPSRKRMIVGIVEMPNRLASARSSSPYKDQVQASGIALLEEYEQHPSIRKLVSEGYEVVTF